MANIFRALRRNRRDRVSGNQLAAELQAVRVVSVLCDISNSNMLITFNKQIQSLPTWSAGMLSFSNNGVDRADTGWSGAGTTTLTVTTAATMVVGQMLVTFLAPSSGITFVGGGNVAGQVAGGGVVA
jgi:hypothetical protein